MKKKKVVVAGHICLDITPVFPKGACAGREIVPGGLVHVEAADIHTGGLVANTGLAMKFFGMDVELMGKIGDDRFGGIILSQLRKWKADTGMIVAPKETTAYSVVLAPPGVDRCFLHCPGANATFSLEDVALEKLRDCVLFHFGYPTLMASMYRNEGTGLEHLMRSVSRMGIVTSMDVSSIDPSSEAGQKDWRVILQKALKFTDIFLPSAEEILDMLGLQIPDTLAGDLGQPESFYAAYTENAIALAGKQLVDWGVGIVVIKCGAAGLYYKTAGIDRLRLVEDKLEISLEKWADKEGFVKSFRPSRIAAATGAGDTSIAAFLSALLMGYPMQDCFDLMAAAGASCVECYDALSGLKTLNALKDKIDRGWERQGGKDHACKLK